MYTLYYQIFLFILLLSSLPSFLNASDVILVIKLIYYAHTHRLHYPKMSMISHIFVSFFFALCKDISTKNLVFQMVERDYLRIQRVIKYCFLVTFAYWCLRENNLI